MSAQPIVDYDSSFPLLPLRGSVLLPKATVPYEVGRPKTVALVERVVADKIPYVVVFTQREAGVDEPSASDLHDLGTLARVVAVEKQRKGNYAIAVEGVARVRLSSIEQTTPYLRARVEPVEPVVTGDDDELQALGLSLREATGKLLEPTRSCPFPARSWRALPRSRPRASWPTSSRPTSMPPSRRKSSCLASST